MTAHPGAGHAAIVQPSSQAEVNDSPLWHFFDYDLGQQTFTLMRIEEALYREASFLDNRVLEYDRPTVRYQLKNLARLFPRPGSERGPMGFVFHVGHCGSTLLSRALAASQKVLPLREPKTLRTLSADHRELDTAMSFMARPHWEWLLTTILDSLGRRFRSDQLNIVKATSTGNNLIGPVMTESEDHRALMMYVPLETYLATMLGSRQEGGDLWTQAQTRMRDWIGIVDEPGFSLHELESPQLAVLSWFTSMNQIISARDRFAGRVRLLEFENFLTGPDRHLAEIASFFGIESETDLIVQEFPGIASGYSKRPEKRYTPETRAQLLQLTRKDHSDEIRSGLKWAASLISATPALQVLEAFIE